MNLQKSNLNLSFLLFLSIGFLFLQCGDNKRIPKSPRIKKLTKVLSPINEFKTNVGIPVKFELGTIQDSVKIYSFRVNLGTDLIYDSKTINDVVFARTGRHNLSFSVYLNNGTKEHYSQFITVRSNVTPTKYTYRKVNTYTHDPDAYTQGLIFDEGILFESTGH